VSKREQLETEYINLYRQAWHSNAGLSTEKIKNMTLKYLKQCVKSLREFVKITEQQREQQRLNYCQRVHN
jgi:hypothetical protein